MSTFESRMEKVTQQRDELLAALKEVLPWVVTNTVACHGMKCRESLCESCFGEDEAIIAAMKAAFVFEKARQAIAKVESEK